MVTDVIREVEQVGPVLEAGATADAVIAAIQELNAGVVVVDRGAYRRVSAFRRCIVTREAIEKELGRAFQLPGDLEKIMPAFQGCFSVSEERAAWLSSAAADQGK